MLVGTHFFSSVSNVLIVASFSYVEFFVLFQYGLKNLKARKTKLGCPESIRDRAGVSVSPVNPNLCRTWIIWLCSQTAGTISTNLGSRAR